MEYGNENTVPAIGAELIVIKPKIVIIIFELMIIMLILKTRGIRTGKTMVA
jgi:hypothetical protein